MNFGQASKAMFAPVIKIAFWSIGSLVVVLVQPLLFLFLQGEGLRVGKYNKYKYLRVGLFQIF